MNIANPYILGEYDNIHKSWYEIIAGDKIYNLHTITEFHEPPRHLPSPESLTIVTMVTLYPI